jgi:hypothetical protein
MRRPITLARYDMVIHAASSTVGEERSFTGSAEASIGCCRRERGEDSTSVRLSILDGVKVPPEDGREGLLLRPAET